MNKNTRPAFHLGVCQCGFLSNPHVFQEPHPPCCCWRWWLGDDHSAVDTSEEGQGQRSCDWMLPNKGQNEGMGEDAYPYPGLTTQPSPYSCTFVSRRPKIILGCHKTVQLFCMAWWRKAGYSHFPWDTFYCPQREWQDLGKKREQVNMGISSFSDCKPNRTSLPLWKKRKKTCINQDK